MVPDENAAEGTMDEPRDPDKDWRNILRRHKVHFWIFDHINAQKADLVAGWVLLGGPEEWQLCSLHGRIAILAWNDAAATGMPKASPGRLDLKRVAFGPQAKQAPSKGPETTLPPREWWDAWWRPHPPSSPDREEAALHELRFMAQQSYLVAVHSRAWQWAVAAGTIGNALPQGPVPNVLSLVNVGWSQTYADLMPPGGSRPLRPREERDTAALTARKIFLEGQDAGPPESLYLALRAAQRALGDNPEDAETYLRLGSAYNRLLAATREGTLTRSSAQLEEIRRTQLTAAYQECLRWRPNPRSAAQAHEALFNVFRQLRYLDVALHHRREQLNSLKEAGPLPGEAPAQQAQRLDALSRDLTPLDDEVRRRLDQYEVTAANKPVLERVRIALDRGLVETALNTLDQAAPAELSGLKNLSMVTQMMGLFLDLGRLDKARDLLVPEPDDTEKPVPPYYLSYHVRLAAARGDYQDADRHLLDALNHAWKDPSGRMSRDSRARIGERVGRVLLAEGLYVTGVPRLPSPFPEIAPGYWIPSGFWARRWGLEAVEGGLLEAQQRAEWYLQRGVLALEAGHCVEARQHFQTVLDLVVPPERWIPEMDRLNVPLSPGELQILQQLPTQQSAARSLSQHYLQWLDAYQR